MARIGSRLFGRTVQSAIHGCKSPSKRLRRRDDFRRTFSILAMRSAKAEIRRPMRWSAQATKLGEDDPHPFTNLAPIANTHDYSRDKFVNAQDQIIARSNGTTVQTALQLIRAPTARRRQLISRSLSGGPGGTHSEIGLTGNLFYGIDSAPAAVALTQLRATAAVFSARSVRKLQRYRHPADFVRERGRMWLPLATRRLVEGRNE